MMLTISEFAAREGVTRQRVLQWVNDGRIPGAVLESDRAGRPLWLIPKTARRPEPLPPIKRRRK